MNIITVDKMEDIDSHRPCFKVDIEPTHSEPVMARYDTNQVMVMICYFPNKNYATYSLRDKLENMFDELSAIFALNFLLRTKDGERRSLIVRNKDYGEELDLEYLKFTFDTEYFNAIPNPDYGMGLNNADPQITTADPIEIMQEVFLDKE